MLCSVALVRTDSEELLWLVMANVVPSSQILVALMMEVLRSPEKSVLTRATRSNIPEDGILHSHHRKNLKSNIQMASFLNLSRVFGNNGIHLT
jgi:hypothetical protein